LELAGAKFLCVVRNPEATLVSFFKFKMMKSGAASGDVNDFILSRAATPGGGTETYSQGPGFGGYLWDFYAEYWRCRNLPNVLLIAYENLKQDLDAHIPVIAEFMGLPPLDASVQSKVAELSSFAWMSKHDHLFDDHHVETRFASKKGNGKGKNKSCSKGSGTTTKVGLELGSDYNTVVLPGTREHLHSLWRSLVTPVTGHMEYKDMVASLVRR